MKNKIITACLITIILNSCNFSVCSACELPQNVIEHLQQKIKEIDQGIENLQQSIDTLKTSHADPSLVKDAIDIMRNQIAELEATRKNLLEKLDQ